MRLLIRVDGHSERGLGHIVRMTRLSKAMVSLGHNVAFCTLADTVGEHLLLETGLPVETLPSAADYGVWKDVVRNMNPDGVLFDVLDVSDPDINALEGRRVVCMDDCAAGVRRADMLINPIVFHWGRYAVSAVSGRYLEGPDFMILPPDLPTFRRAEVREKENIRVLIAFGGTDTHGLSGRVLRAVSQVSQPLSVRVNLGPGAIPAADLAEAAQMSPHHVEILSGVPSLLDEFAQSDLVVCGGGVMLYELAALGIPAAALATEDHEALNISWFGNQGTVTSLGHFRSATTESLTEILTTVIADGNRRSRMAVVGPTIVDGQGLWRCIRAVESLMP